MRGFWSLSDRVIRQRSTRSGVKKTDAYFTVEAALVMPVVAATVVLMIYLLFFQYDRCLMEQNTGRLVLRGYTDPLTDGDELVRKLKEMSQRRDERFLGWELEEARIVLTGNQLSIRQRGQLKFPFQGLAFWKGDNAWSGECSYECDRILPVQFIRDYRKIKGK